MLKNLIHYKMNNSFTPHFKVPFTTMVYHILAISIDFFHKLFLTLDIYFLI